MAEAVAVIGAAASVISIIDVLARSIGTIRALKDQWRDADFTVLNLIAQLSALKAALSKIQEWMDGNFEEPHHQLVMDMDDSLTCCGILVGKLDILLSEFQQAQKPDGRTAASAKLKITFGSKGMDDLQKMIERQTNAMTLLLTACNL